MISMTYAGTPDELEHAILVAAKENDREILVDRAENRFWIGFERHGHSNGGRWFCAEASAGGDCTTLTGEIRDVPLETPKHPKWDAFVMLVVEYLILGFVPIVMFLALGLTKLTAWMLLLPFPLMVLLEIRAKRMQHREDEKFIKFMEDTGCTIHTEDMTGG